ncbi:hypothetical protein GCM10020001_021200 [Nonomuraea salmonea]
MPELHELSALDQARSIRSRDISPVELTRHYLDRIQRIDPGIGAYVTVTGEQAVDQARSLERELPDGPLAGVPIPVKDLNLVKDVPIRFGSATYRDFVAPVDDTVVTRLRAAGTIMLGKTATPEFGLPCYTETSVGPPARSPWDPRTSAGGSSGGAAAAVAAGLAPRRPRQRRRGLDPHPRLGLRPVRHQAHARAHQLRADHPRPRRSVHERAHRPYRRRRRGPARRHGPQRAR